MNSDEIQKISLLWRLNRQDFQDDITVEENLFTIAGFITRHRRLLYDCPIADIMLARIHMELDEFAAAAECLHRLKENFSGIQNADAFLTGPFTGYKIKRRGIAGPESRIIFDCKGFLNGRPVPETECYFKMTTLGTGALIEDFDQGTGRPK